MADPAGHEHMKLAWRGQLDIGRGVARGAFSRIGVFVEKGQTVQRTSSLDSIKNFVGSVASGEYCEFKGQSKNV